MKSLLANVVLTVACCFVAIPASSGAPSTLGGVNSSDDPLQDSHIVVRGAVVGIEQYLPTLQEMGLVAAGDVTADVRVGATRVRVAIEEVLRGSWKEREITFVARGAAWRFRVGTEYVVCGFLAGPPSGRYFLTGSGVGFYERDKGSGGWRRCMESERLHVERLTDAALRARVHEVDLEEVVRQSDVVVEGVITRTWRSEFRVGADSTGALLHYAVNVKETLKGKPNRSTIEFVVPELSPTYWPAWSRVVPEGIAPGQEWLMLLKSGDRGLYPFAGRNSLLLIDGDRLVFDRKVDYHRTVGEARRVIRQEVADESE